MTDNLLFNTSRGRRTSEITCGAVGRVETNQIYDPRVRSQWSGGEGERWS